MSERQLDIHTLVVTGGHEPHSRGVGPATPSIVPSVGFIHPSMAETDQALGAPGKAADDPANHIYARQGTPNPALLEQALAALEGAQGALTFGSGMGALHAALPAIVPPGGVIVAARQLYGTTLGLLNWLAASAGVTVHSVDFLDSAAACRFIEQIGPSAVICETLTNPLVRVVDIEAIAGAAKKAGARLIVDNTFATPYLLQPLRLGVDLVMHSTTKFINGHGDALGGVVLGMDEDLLDKVRTHRRVLGGVPGPFEAWLTLRGLRTFAVRMAHACRSAQRIAAWLADQPWVRRVGYPGLPDDAGHTVARRLFRPDVYGAMLCFELREADKAAAFSFVDRLRVIHPVTSLGDVNTLISHPATASHRTISAEQRAEQGITEGTLRISVGIEDADDLIADLDQAARG